MGTLLTLLSAGPGLGLLMFLLLSPQAQDILKRHALRQKDTAKQNAPPIPGTSHEE